MRHCLVIADLVFFYPDITNVDRVKGKGIQASSLGISTSVGLAPAISLSTDIRPRSANYTYAVAVGAGAAVGFSINGQSVASVNVGASTN